MRPLSSPALTLVLFCIGTCAPPTGAARGRSSMRPSTRARAPASPRSPSATPVTAYVPGTRSVVAVGPGGIAFSASEGAAWRRVDTLAYWGAAFASPQAGWLVGPEGRITRMAVRPE